MALRLFLAMLMLLKVSAENTTMEVTTTTMDMNSSDMNATTTEDGTAVGAANLAVPSTAFLAPATHGFSGP